MRYIIQDDYEKLYNTAKDETKKFIRYTLDDISYITKLWNDDIHESVIVWLEEDEVKQQDGICGNSSGLYLFYSDDGEEEIGIYLAGASEEYYNFFDSIVQLHNGDNDLYYETIPNFFDVWYDGKNRITAEFICNLADMPASVYTSAKIIANEIVKMLSDLKGPYQVSFYEGDDEGYVGFENRKTSNYYVGIKVEKQI